KFSTVNIKYLLIALGFFSLGYFVRSFRWIEMLRFMKIKIPVLKNIIIYFTGYAFSLTPGKVGEGIRSKYLKDSFEVSITRSLPTVLAERYYDVIGVIAIIFITVGLTQTGSFMVYAGIALLVFFYFSVRKKIALKLLSPLNRVKRLQAIQHNLIESVEVLETLLKPKIFVQCSFLTIVSWMAEAVGAYFVFKSFHLEFGILKGAFDYVTTSLAGAATLLPGGVGGTEASLIGLLLLQGHSYDDILGAVLMIRFFALWYVIIIGIVFTSIYKMNQRRYISK
ncbi:MAG: flippase-like domain-containing protein, partial [Thaumarchaeota archaeon]|nr:flippase-like domain-containing protein [Nitrososphaerota archaeon]